MVGEVLSQYFFSIDDDNAKITLYMTGTIIYNADINTFLLNLLYF